jgi:hypothetical protein
MGSHPLGRGSRDGSYGRALLMAGDFELGQLLEAGIDPQKALDLRLSWKIGPSRADQPELRADIEDGMVRGFRVRSAADVLAELIEECAGEVDAT